MASRPFFSAEFGLSSQTATFSVTRSGGIPATCTVVIPPDRYFLGGSTNARNLVTPLMAALTALPIGSFSFSIQSTTDNLGVQGRILYNDGATPGALTSLTFTSLNAVAVDLFWAIGFRNISSLTFTIDPFLSIATVLTTGVPRYSWFSKSFVVNQDDYSTVAQQARSSRLTGAGTIVSSVRQDDGVIRWWRSWRMTQVAAARASYPKAVSTYTPEWATIAGLTSNPGDSALDKEDGWWQRTCAGQYRFAAIEDESDANTPNWDVYRIIDDEDAPVGMGGWRNLRAPNVSVYSTAGATRTLEFCAVASRVGLL
jgi:hypothetical protein